MKPAWKLIALVLALWICTLLYMYSSLFSSGNDSANSDVAVRLSKAIAELELVRTQNDELHRSIISLRRANGENVEADSVQDLQKRLDVAHTELRRLQENNDCSPSKDFERVRRKVSNGVEEMWFYLHNQLSRKPDIISLKNILVNGAEHQRSIINDLEVLKELEDESGWRQKEHDRLSELVQNRIHHLQNPKDCDKAKKLVCRINKGCGYGCELHHAVYCFIVAFGLGRTMILESSGWRYSPGGWEKVFLPLSETCTSASGSPRRTWSSDNEGAQVVDLPIVDSVRPRPPHLPLSVPRDLAAPLQRAHGHPAVWWVGQFLKYMCRFQPDVARGLEATKFKLRFQSPIVGVHVRRTDKVGTEAARHEIQEYMFHVDEYYERLELRSTVDKRRVYLATDEPTLIAEARTLYPKYEIIGDAGIAQSASVGSRYSEASLKGIILDIHFLSLTDFLVCTFSSQVCRVAYELMNHRRADAADKFRSLDDIYYFGGQHAHRQRAVLDHKPAGPREIELRVGDEVGVAGNHWDGYSLGTNRRTGHNGLYPSFKVEDIIDLADFPTFPGR